MTAVARGMSPRVTTLCIAINGVYIVMTNPYLQNKTNTYSSQDLIAELDINRSIHPKGGHQAHANTGDDTSSNHKRAIISDERSQNTTNGRGHNNGDDDQIGKVWMLDACGVAS